MAPGKGRTPTAESSNDPPAKRPRLDPAGKDDVQASFRAGLLDPPVRRDLAGSYAKSKPYLHCVIDGLMEDTLLRKVKDEITSSLHFTVKETDIYKVFQTGDLANLDGLPESELAQLQSLFRLRNALYSAEFRKFIGDVTGCGLLSGSKQDMSINNYLQGCHLINHDDVIGSRRVSYILYLTDPDARWDPKDGGALELYPVLEKGTPAVSPSVAIPPQWNQFAMFTVQPGHSFHSVEEVVAKDKSRLSISGWFHLPQQGEEGYVEEKEDGDAPSSLEQLQAETAGDLPFRPYDTPMDPESTGLSEDDIAFLSKWMNPQYLSLKTLSQISTRFLEESSIQLTDFLNKEFIAKVEAATRAADQLDGLTGTSMAPHGTGERGAWKAYGPPHKHRYMVLDTETQAVSTDPATTHLADLSALFSSSPYRAWLALLTNLIPSSHRGLVRRFRPGLDYTLATSSANRILDSTLCLATRLNEEDVELWESDEVGGYDCYMMPHEGEEDPAVYKQMDDDGALLTVSAGWNVLNLVLRDSGLLKFIKYISARAPGSRWDLAFEFEMPEDDDSGSEGEDE